MSYSYFAQVYDLLTENVEYSERADYICSLLSENGINGGLLLDLACGTGSMSESIIQPDFLPDRFESGTINTAGVVALGGGVDFVNKHGKEKILAHELEL